MNIENSEQRKFLHDLATPLAGAKIILNRVIKSMQSISPQLTEEQILERLKKCSDLLIHIENIHADYKERLSK